MKSTYNFIFLPYLIIFCYLLFISVICPAQEAEIIEGDSLSGELESIELANISIRSGELLIDLRKTVEGLIPDEEIESLRQENDSILSMVDSLIKQDEKIRFKSKNIRYLNNTLLFWEDIASNIEGEKSSRTNLVHGLDKQNYNLEKEIRLWENTKSIISEKKSSQAASQRINDLINKLDSIETLIRQKSEMLLFQLDRTTRKEVRIRDHIQKIEEIKIEKTEDVFSRNQPALWAIDYENKRNLSIEQPINDFYLMEVIGLKKYFYRNVPNFIFQMVLLILLAIAFPLIKRKLLSSKIDDSSFYQKNLIRSLSQPISAGLILGLFASIIIFSNRPLLFKDITKFIIMIPLVIIVVRLVPNKFNKYIYIFGVLVILQFPSFIFPPGHALYSLSLVGLAVIELIALYGLFKYTRKHPLTRKFLNKLLWVVLIVHLGFAFAGLVGIIAGATVLAELTTNFVLINALASILIVTSAIIVNGLIEVSLASQRAQKLNFIISYGPTIRKKTIELINFSAIVFILHTMLRIMNIDKPVTDFILTIFTSPINIGLTSFTLGGVFIFFLVIWLSIVISNMIRVILEKDVLDKLNLGKGVPHTMAVMVKYTLVTIGLLLAVSAAGMPLSSLTILFGAFGVGIGFGLQNIFNNLVSGLILLFERPIQIGDTIEVGQLMGNVKSIGIRSSNVRTFDGAEVIVPNGQLISNEVVNWTLSDQRRRIEVLAGVAYGSDPHKVRKLFQKVLNDHPDIISEPAPKVLFKDLGESSLDFRLLFWTNNFDEWIRIKSEVVFNVHDMLYEEGIEIPFPQRDLHLRSVDENITIVQKDKES